MEKKLYIFVEGVDDEDFFNYIKWLIPKWQDLAINIIQYEPPQNGKIRSHICQFIKSIKVLGADYIFVADIDQSPCVTAKKKQLIDIWDCLDPDKILIVIMEIESWYLAGVDENRRRKLGIKVAPTNTDNFTKEDFKKIKPSNYKGRAFKQKLLESFSIETAKKNNKSFAYFLRKFG